MKKLTLLILLVMLFTATAIACSSNSNEESNNDKNNTQEENDKLDIKSNEEAKKEYDKYYSQWTDKNIKSYYMKFYYGAFSPNRGVCEITFENGEATKILHEGKEPTEGQKEAISKIDMEFLFELAKGSYNNKEDGQFLQIAEYDDSYNGVKLVKMIYNPNYDGPQMTDVTWKYEVIEFEMK